MCPPVSVLKSSLPALAASHCCDQTLTRNNLREERAYVASSSLPRSVAEESQGRNLAAGTVAETPGEYCGLACSAMPKGGTAHRKMGPPTSVGNLKTCPTEEVTSPSDQGCAPTEVPSPQVSQAENEAMTPPEYRWTFGRWLSTERKLS